MVGKLMSIGVEVDVKEGIRGEDSWCISGLLSKGNIGKSGY